MSVDIRFLLGFSFLRSSGVFAPERLPSVLGARRLAGSPRYIRRFGDAAEPRRVQFCTTFEVTFEVAGNNGGHLDAILGTGVPKIDRSCTYRVLYSLRGYLRGGR